MQIIHFPHPTLRYKSKPVKRVDAELRGMIAEMFDLMYQARGIGLAANQVGIPLRFFVMNLAGEKGEGEELVFINPAINRGTGSDEAEEGCLSLPGVYGAVMRPSEILFSAYMPNGEKFEQKVDGLFARCVQHETDHLDGIMFTDRMDEDSLYEIQPQIDKFELTFERLRGEGKLPTDEEIVKFQGKLEEKYA
ncbi:peptide deformylase [Blastopirellula marina]|uniref:Peptide deformylase n=1 Tax=Blastopirellula marina TaxID=124 RepID=A0A2S8FGM8_9BACT|nr:MULTISPECIES: peptide deformylase [Pirellulaceae]PQO31250.1 peptide deformylase [Blastopirellula marina]RCS51644.1 peptide deformylase [Bremerella cremea]